MSISKGRPTKKSQQVIADALRPYFEHNLSATFTAHKTGHDIKTVCSYFNEWSSKITRTDEEDFISRQRQEIQNIIFSIDGLIFEEYQLLDELKAEVNNHKEKQKSIPNYFITSIQDCIKTISGLVEKKASYILTLPTDDVIEKTIQEVLKRHE